MIAFCVYNSSLAGNDATSHQGNIMDFEEYRILLSRINYIRDRYLENDNIYDGRVFDMILKIRNELEAVYPDHYEQFNNWR
jgi:hypothetical protein